MNPATARTTAQTSGGHAEPLNAASMWSAVAWLYSIRAAIQERPITRQSANSGAAMARTTLTGRVFAVGLNLVSELFPSSVVTSPLTPPLDASHAPPILATAGGPSRTS